MKEKHSHSLQFVRHFEHPGHIHGYDTQTSVTGRHRHRMRGRTSPPEGTGYGHVHYYEGTTSYDDGHVHHYKGWTGPPIPLPNGNHYHEFSGQTTYDDGHIHYYRGVRAKRLDETEGNEQRDHGWAVRVFSTALFHVYILLERPFPPVWGLKG